MNNIINLIKGEIERIELRHKVELLEKEKEIEVLKKQLKTIKDECKISLLTATKIKWSDDGKYYNLKDFCRVTRDLLFINETNLKQYLYREGILTKQDDKYIPSTNSTTCILIDNELYIEYSYIRKNILFLRTCIYLDKELERHVEMYENVKDSYLEKMANTVYVECKQRSEEFREHKENKFFIEDKQQQKIK